MNLSQKLIFLLFLSQRATKTVIIREKGEAPQELRVRPQREPTSLNVFCDSGKNGGYF